MKLMRFELKNNYVFSFDFEDGLKKVVDISDLVKDKISKDELKTARINKEWGCLEFNNGMVDIEPKTLYKYITGSISPEVATHTKK